MKSYCYSFDNTGDLFYYPGGFLHSVESGAGKRRVFAIWNWVNQRFLWPLEVRNEVIFLLYNHILKLEDPPEIVISLIYLDFSGLRIRSIFPERKNNPLSMKNAKNTFFLRVNSRVRVQLGPSPVNHEKNTNRLNKWFRFI